MQEKIYWYGKPSTPILATSTKLDKTSLTAPDPRDPQKGRGVGRRETSMKLSRDKDVKNRPLS